MIKPEDSWQSGHPYERFMGRWSRLIAQEFLEWLPVPKDRDWLDVGCGTGTLSSLIWRTRQPKGILAIDSSPEFIAFAREYNSDHRFQFEIGLAQSLPIESNRFDAVVSGLVLNFVPQPEHALTEMRRVTKSGGVVAAYVWDYSDGMQMLRFFWDAAVALDRDAARLDEGIRFPLCQEGNLKKLFLDSGLREVRFKSLEVRTVFSSFEDYWLPFLGGVGPAPSYVMNLDEIQRIELRERLRESLPESEDGTIPLLGRAWAVQGRV